VFKEISSKEEMGDTFNGHETNEQCVNM